MSFNDFVLRAAFGAQAVPDAYEFALLRAGKPVQGYSPPSVARSRWTHRDHGVSATVRFGPAKVALVFDQVQVRGAGVEVDVFDVGEVSLPPGMVFDFEASFNLADSVGG